MSGAEGVVDVDVGVAGQRLRELGIVLLFLGVEAQVLEEDALARLEALDGILGAGTQRVARDRDGHFEEWESRSATGRRRMLSWTLPSGRPRWLARMTIAPWASSALIVGSAATIRLSSVILPSSSGTLKSTRTKTRLAGGVQVADRELVHRYLGSGWARIGTGGHSDRPDRHLALVRGARR